MKKKLTLFALLTLSFLVFAQVSYSQTQNIEAGEMYEIFLKNGNIVVGRIIEFDDQRINVRINDGHYVTAFNNEDISHIVKIEMAKKGSVGAGLGVPYGTFGLNAEFVVHNHLNLSAGLGSTVFAGAGYGLGAKGYFTPVGEKWRPRLSAHYGVNSIILLDHWDNGEKFAGFVLGLGIQGMFGKNRRHGFDFDIIYIASNGDFDERLAELKRIGYYGINEPGRIKVSLGYRYGF